MRQRIESENLVDILKIDEIISHINDIDSLLERVLFEVRKITNADAGTIYLVKKDKLVFEHVQNDTLIENNKSSIKYLYKNQEIPINNNSISGYVAKNRKPLVIENVYDIGGHAPYSFNPSFDNSASYQTQSLLTVPLITINNKVIGVIQIINAKDGNYNIIPFSEYDEYLLSLFANRAAIAIERAKITREIILRMIKIAELRDPEETASHVNRVGAYAIEIYQQWAEKNNIAQDEVKRVKDILRISAMLHDVGKVAISDKVLKKNKHLNKNEYQYMKRHTIFGARLFTENFSDWDEMAAEISLNHHEKWDGSGYPGKIDNIFQKHVQFQKGKKGDEIPFYARIVALADVYDALITRRSYKESWPEERVLDFIHDKTNTHFDPEVSEAFFEICDVIKTIREKYPS